MMVRVKNTKLPPLPIVLGLAIDPSPCTCRHLTVANVVAFLRSFYSLGSSVIAHSLTVDGSDKKATRRHCCCRGDSGTFVLSFSNPPDPCQVFVDMHNEFRTRVTMRCFKDAYHGPLLADFLRVYKYKLLTYRYSVSAMEIK